MTLLKIVLSSASFAEFHRETLIDLHQVFRPGCGVETSGAWHRQHCAGRSTGLRLTTPIAHDEWEISAIVQSRPLCPLPHRWRMCHCPSLAYLLEQSLLVHWFERRGMPLDAFKSAAIAGDDRSWWHI